MPSGSIGLLGAQQRVSEVQVGINVDGELDQDLLVQFDRLLRFSDPPTRFCESKHDIHVTGSVPPAFLQFAMR